MEEQEPEHLRLSVGTFATPPNSGNLYGDGDGDDNVDNSMLSNLADVVDAVLRMQTQMEGMMQMMGTLQNTVERLIPEQQHFQDRFDVTENRHSLLEAKVEGIELTLAQVQCEQAGTASTQQQILERLEKDGVSDCRVGL